MSGKQNKRPYPPFEVGTLFLDSSPYSLPNHSSYRWGHYLGALIIIIGIVVALLHAFLSSNGASGNTVFGIVVFFASCMPTAFSVGLLQSFTYLNVDCLR